MKEITLKIPDSNFPFFMELINKLGFEVTQKQDFALTQEMKNVLDERLAEDKSTYKPAKESLNKIRAKYGL